MRWLLTFACAALIACACAASPEAVSIYLPLGTATVRTQELAQVHGYIQDVYVSVSGGVATGNVAVFMIPQDGVTAAVLVASNTVVGSKTFRPRIDSTDTVGAALTSDGPESISVAGDALRVIVDTSSSTGVTWRATIILDK